MDGVSRWRRGAPQVDGYYLARHLDRTVVAPCLLRVEGGITINAGSKSFGPSTEAWEEWEHFPLNDILREGVQRGGD